MSRLYVLELEGGKYYVGVSDNPEARFLYHANGDGAAWTRMHQPIRIVEIRECRGQFEEDAVTKEYMAKHGIDNVRGGSYVQIVLRPEIKRALKREIWMAEGACMRCGHTSHYVGECYARTDVDGDPIEEIASPRPLQERNVTGIRSQERNGAGIRAPFQACPGAMRPSNRGHTHYPPARQTEQERWFLEGRCTRCGAESHFVRDCYARRDINGNPLEDEPPAPETCRRCGRTGHRTQECYASTNVSGRELRY